jgi:protein SCO1
MELMHRVVSHVRFCRPLSLALTVLCLCAAACGPRARVVTLEGQVLAVDTARREITIKHGDISGFMPGMTMPFKVREPRLLEGKTAGDMVRATLVVDDTEAYLSAVEKTGHAALTEAPPPPRMELLTPGDVVPDTSFVDAQRKPRHLADWRGQAIAVTFIYTRCPLPDFCPLMDRRFAEVQRTIVADVALRAKVHLVSVSFDPTFDTPTVLGAHAAKVGADPAVWTFVTGEQPEVERFASRFGVSVMRERANPDEVVHNLRTAVIDREGRLVNVLNGNEWQASELVTALRTVVGAR